MPVSTLPYRPNAPIVPELAAGVVIFGSDGKLFLLHQADEDRWCLPKGHVDPGESLESAARREVQEETGFEHVKLEGELREVTYRFFHPRKAMNIHKTVVYFLGSTAEWTPHLEPIFDRGEWVDPAEAVRRVPFPTDRSVLEAAGQRRRTSTPTSPDSQK